MEQAQGGTWRPRFTIARLMAMVVVAALVLAVFRALSFAGLVALIPFAITALIARLGSTPTVRRRVLLVGVVGAFVLPFLAAIAINHAMWGYFISRPTVDDRIAEARQVKTVTHVETETDPNGRRAFLGSAFSVASLEQVAQPIPQGGEGGYYVLDDRVLRALKHRNALPDELSAVAPDRLKGLYQVLKDTGRLEDGEPGYSDAKQLRGTVVEALGRDGSPLLFLGIRGGQVSNDHYPYYEFLFTGELPDGPLQLLSFQRFYYDVAGLEGLEWPAFLPFFAFLSLIPTLPVTGFLLWCG